MPKSIQSERKFNKGMEKSADLFQMAPRNDKEKLKEEIVDMTPNESEGNMELEEIAAVNDSLDSLSSALDFIEKRTDDIKAQLLELLNSNREIRRSFMMNESIKE